MWQLTTQVSGEREGSGGASWATERSMIVITRNGKTTVLTGWQAWLVGAVALLVAWVVLAAVAFVVVGVGITIVAMLLLTIPAAILVGLLASVVRGRG